MEDGRQVLISKDMIAGIGTDVQKITSHTERHIQDAFPASCIVSGVCCPVFVKIRRISGELDILVKMKSSAPLADMVWLNPEPWAEP